MKGLTQTRLLETGERIFLEKGYNHTGIQAVLKDAGVPKGSFYHYFKSKEDFGLQVVEASNAAYLDKLEQFFNDETRSPLARLQNYFESGIQAFAANDFRCGCLVGNLSQEMASQNDTFRQRLDEILLGWRERFAQCLAEAQEAGELCSSWDVKVLANFCIDSWEGAILRGKVTQSTEPLETFVAVLFKTVLAAKAPEALC
ncbi:MAG: TetR family transcriptional regulator [Merismopedia sp. SIO2A8]|nr:TetR family transcriptional regulator [Merismopedia sp. SIO2A8]